MTADNVHLRDGHSSGHQRPTRRRQVTEGDPGGGDFHQRRSAARHQRQKKFIGMPFGRQRKCGLSRQQAGLARIGMIAHHHLQPGIGRGPVVIGDDQTPGQARGQHRESSAGHTVSRLPHRQNPHPPPG